MAHIHVYIVRSKVGYVKFSATDGWKLDGGIWTPVSAYGIQDPVSGFLKWQSPIVLCKYGVRVNHGLRTLGMMPWSPESVVHSKCGAWSPGSTRDVGMYFGICSQYKHAGL